MLNIVYYSPPHLEIAMWCSGAVKRGSIFKDLCEVTRKGLQGGHVQRYVRSVAPHAIPRTRAFSEPRALHWCSLGPDLIEQESRPEIFVVSFEWRCL